MAGTSRPRRRRSIETRRGKRSPGALAKSRPLGRGRKFSFRGVDREKTVIASTILRGLMPLATVRDRRSPPLDDISVSIIMRRLDEYHQELTFRLRPPHKVGL